MRPFIAHSSEQLDPPCNTTDIPPPQSATLTLHPVIHMLLISRPTDRRLGLKYFQIFLLVFGTLLNADVTVGTASISMLTENRWLMVFVPKTRILCDLLMTLQFHISIANKPLNNIHEETFVT